MDGSIKQTFKTWEELTRDELYAILQLRTEVFVVEQDCPYQECDGRDQDSVHLMLEKNGLVAYLRVVLPKPGQDPAIGRVVVKRSERMNGYGIDLMKSGIEWCRDHYPNQGIRISAQVYLKRFYEDLGFVGYGEEYLEDGIPHRAMRLEF
ncbi:GNAT family N-acetyltransferase [bacterium SCSIO 12741]|nr:GNAT family N-acetyltransferase [bacterium SCSIO 12741]